MLKLTLSVPFPAPTLRRFRARARASGLTLETYLEGIVSKNLGGISLAHAVATMINDAAQEASRKRPAGRCGAA